MNARRLAPAVLAACLIAWAAPRVDAQAHRPGPRRPGLARIPLARDAGTAMAARARARELLLLFLRRGLRETYVGDQTTRLLQGRVQDSHQIVRQAGAGRVRIEWLSPPELRGEVILISAGRILHYKPSLGVILVGAAPPAEMRERVRELGSGLRDGRIRATAVGSEVVAGQSASIVEVRSVGGGEFYRRFWIDERTGVRLKHETLDPEGRVVTTTYFTRIDYEARPDEADFRPASLPRVPHAPLLPETEPFTTLAAARAASRNPIREPDVPPGFALTGAWVVPGGPGRETAILRYSDGVNTFALFQSPAPAAVARPPHFGIAVVHWVTGGRAYTLVGSLKRANLRRIIDSLR